MTLTDISERYHITLLDALTVYEKVDGEAYSEEVIVEVLREAYKTVKLPYDIIDEAGESCDTYIDAGKELSVYKHMVKQYYVSTALYNFYDAEFELEYVGYSQNLEKMAVTVGLLLSCGETYLSAYLISERLINEWCGISADTYRECYRYLFAKKGKNFGNFLYKVFSSSDMLEPLKQKIAKWRDNDITKQRRDENVAVAKEVAKATVNVGKDVGVGIFKNTPIAGYGYLWYFGITAVILLIAIVAFYSGFKITLFFSGAAVVFSLLAFYNYYVKNMKDAVQVIIMVVVAALFGIISLISLVIALLGQLLS